jgi:hypothetical protein
MEETILLLSGGRREPLDELDDMLAFEARFAKVIRSFPCLLNPIVVIYFSHIATN